MAVRRAVEPVRRLWLALMVFWPGLALAEPPADRKAELAYFLEQDCGSCHGLTRQGGLGSPLLPERLAEAGDDAWVEIILRGVPGTPMPPWEALLNREDALWIVTLLRKGAPP